MRFKVISSLAIAGFLFSGCSSQTLKETLEKVNEQLNTGSLTTSEVAAGLKEALVKGTENSVKITSLTNGFYKNPEIFIPFPEEAEKVRKAAEKVGLNNQVAKFEETLNRAAEEAVKQATPIFVNAITSMTIEDAFALLKGGDKAATDFLYNKTKSELAAKFSPKVQDAINKVELTKYWSPLASAYNTSTAILGGEKINPDLTAYVTDRAIDGLFVQIAKEEKRIRENPSARVTELLKKVFGSPEAQG